MKTNNTLLTMVVWRRAFAAGVATAVLVAAATGCGKAEGGSPTEGPASRSTGDSGSVSLRHFPRSDSDKDSVDRNYNDIDDAEIVDYGHAANPADRQAITALVTRYDKAVLAADGATGCALSYPLYAEGIVEDYSNGLPRGKTCEEVMSKLFKRAHANIAEVMKSRITAVRVNGERGYAIFGANPEIQRFILIHRESGVWKVEAPQPQELG